MDKTVLLRYFKVRHLANAIVRQLRAEVIKLGFESDGPKIAQASNARYRLEKDPYSNEESLVGEWFDEKNKKLGNLLFHADGSFFVEHDVVLPHPCKPRWFVEAVNAWGRDYQIKAEARLLPFPE